MVGRTPEYLGKKIQAPEMKMVALYILAMPTVVLGFTAASMFVGSVLDVTMWNSGPHGFSEILYAFTSAGNNNGSAFAGITAATRLDGHDARPRHAGRPVLPDPPGPGPRRLARPEAHDAGDDRHVPDPHPAVRGSRHRCRRASSAA